MEADEGFFSGRRSLGVIALRAAAVSAPGPRDSFSDPPSFRSDYRRPLDGEVREVGEAEELGDEDAWVLQASHQHLEVAEDGHMGFDGEVAEEGPEEDDGSRPDGVEGLVG